MPNITLTRTETSLLTDAAGREHGLVVLPRTMKGATEAVGQEVVDPLSYVGGGHGGASPLSAIVLRHWGIPPWDRRSGSHPPAWLRASPHRRVLPGPASRPAGSRDAHPASPRESPPVSKERSPE